MHHPDTASSRQGQWPSVQPGPTHLGCVCNVNSLPPTPMQPSKCKKKVIKAEIPKIVLTAQYTTVQRDSLRHTHVHKTNTHSTHTGSARTVYHQRWCMAYPNTSSSPYIGALMSGDFLLPTPPSGLSLLVEDLAASTLSESRQLMQVLQAKPTSPAG